MHNLAPDPIFLFLMVICYGVTLSVLAEHSPIALRLIRRPLYVRMGVRTDRCRCEENTVECWKVLHCPALPTRY